MKCQTNAVNNELRYCDQYYAVSKAANRSMSRKAVQRSASSEAIISL